MLLRQLSLINYKNFESKELTFDAKINENGTGYYVVVADGDTPTSAQVKNGTEKLGKAASIKEVSGAVMTPITRMTNIRKLAATWFLANQAIAPLLLSGSGIVVSGKPLTPS